MAFNSKNLSYDRQEPAFLRKMRGESGGVDSDRHAHPAQRPRKPKNKDDEDDDAPTYVDEETNDTITKKDYEALLKGSEDKPETTGAEGDGDAGSGESKEPTNASSAQASNTAGAPMAQEKMAEIGSQKRKKQARVVGGDDDEVAAEEEAPRKDSSSSRRPKAKKKKVKLSFDEA
ncbi:uncharacterized protein TRUGW13939_05467 [Talaromyces rugulosus]|uniref:DUF4604 domain-containing protein n=1 Tax=Talaromyces rugulosus TaxID=121627 RepID=A0A7H8QY14_TALRU|nr:uncharacterized protein TRUGW13939_05467 [Talaromyces rugulosus]QKX58345.1 hypothetical protein TRUGW13939_05467 [Talaromyces rugulosus]